MAQPLENGSVSLGLNERQGSREQGKVLGEPVGVSHLDAESDIK